MVFEAEDRARGVRVALKLIHTRRDDEAFRVRVEREIAILRALEHPHVVRYLDSGITDDTLIHLVLEWLSGEDLADHCAKRALGLGAALGIASQVADALEAAHARGIVHRDVKPANVFLVEGEGEGPSVRVLDFGVAKQSEAAGVTQAGAILGTPSYMAPEQAQQARKVDGRADVFSLGVVLFEMISGRLPWSSHSELARLARILVEPAMPLAEAAPGVPASVAETVDAMLAIDPEARVPSMSEVRRRLAACVEALDQTTASRVYAPVVPVAALEAFGRIETKSVQAAALDPGPAEPTPIFDMPSVRTEPRASFELAETTEGPAPTSPIEEGASLSHVRLQGRGELFGRDALLASIESEVERAQRERRPTGILLLGPAGAGKTRVRTELQRRLRRITPAPVVLAGRAEEPVRAAPHRLLRRLLLQDARVFPGDPVEERQRKLSRLVPEGDGTDTWVGPPATAPMSASPRALALTLFGAVMGVPASGAVSLDALRADPFIFSSEVERVLDQVLSARGGEEGLVLLVDDAHLLDAKSAEVLARLVDRGREGRWVVIAFAQPTIQSAEEPGSRLAEACHVTIDLPPLEPSDASLVVRGIVGAPLDPTSEGVLVAKAGGSPLQLEQLTRAVLEARVLERERDGQYRLSAAARAEGSELVPPTAAAAVRARLRQLGTELQRTLVAAAVFGDLFWLEGVAEISEQSLERVTEHFERLLLADFVRRRPAARYRDVSELEFSHAVIRRVVLSKLRPAARQPLELRAARFLEARGEADAATLAGHLVRGGESERGALRLSEAARLSLSLGAFVDALRLAEEGLEALGSPESAPDVSAELLLVTADSAAQLDREAEAEEALRRLLELPLGHERRADALLSRARTAVRTERYAEGRAHVAAALLEHERGGRTEPRGEAELVRARCDEAMAAAREALRGYLGVKARAEAAGDRALLGQAVRGLARIGLASGDPRTAEARFKEAEAHARACLDLAGQFESTLGLAEVKLRIGELSESEQLLAAAETWARTREQEGRAEIRRALWLAASGEEERARELLAAIARTASSSRLASLSLLHTVYLEAGAVEPEWPLDRLAALRETHGRLEREHRALALPLDMALALVAAIAGQKEEARHAHDAARLRFAREGALVEVEAPLFLLARVLVLEHTGARAEERSAALVEVVEQLDLVGSRLERGMRGAYLERALVRKVLALAEAQGLRVHRDALSGRLNVEPGRGVP